jgi:hypothetical protein
MRHGRHKQEQNVTRKTTSRKKTSKPALRKDNTAGKSSFVPDVIVARKKTRVLNVRPDKPDMRDHFYNPSLILLAPEIPAPDFPDYDILDQGAEGACTGFGLTAVINLLNVRAGIPFKASPVMLYEMARKHDEWPGEDHAGSSCRGAIRGWKNMGVCSWDDWPFTGKGSNGELTIERAYKARSHTLGCYYRLRPEITHYHAALNETGALFVSASVHGGWNDPVKLDPKDTLATIQPHDDITGGHAFAIVGYNARGFIVQNSWGKGWGTNGFAIWLYEDWIRNVSDGWVFRMAIPTPQIFGLAASYTTSAAEGSSRIPKRLEIAGHFVHFDDGKFKERGDFWSTANDTQQTANLILDRSNKDKYQHLLIYCHGGLNSPNLSASRIAALKEGHKRNGIYPFHIVYDTGLGEEVKDSVLRAGRRSEGIADRLQENIADFSDKLLEDTLRAPVTAIWEEIKRGARMPFETVAPGKPSDGSFVIQTFAETLKAAPMKIHLVGHSTGAIILGHLMKALDALQMPDLIASCSLMAPACTIDFYNEHYAPRLGKPVKGSMLTRLPALDVYNLDAQREMEDTVGLVYRKSLLYLVSNALERQKAKPLLGMEIFAKKLPSTTGLKLIYSDGQTGNITRSTTHGGFDNDIYTMNSIMRRILGAAPPLPFAENEMQGY